MAATFFAERASEIVLRRHAILTGSAALAQAPGNSPPSRDCSRTGDGENGGHVVTEPEEVSWVDEVGSGERRVPAEEAVLEYCLLFAQTALQPVSRGARKEGERII